MRLRRIAMTVLLGAALGLLVAFPLASDRRISVQVWFVAAAVWVTSTMIMRLLRVAPLTRAPVRRSRPLLERWRARNSRHTPDERPDELRSLELLIVHATRNPRAHAVRLRPRLNALAAHHLPIRHGIDPQTDPGRTAELLGDVAWLVDPDAGERCPTLDDVENFVDVVLNGGP